MGGLRRTQLCPRAAISVTCRAQWLAGAVSRGDEQVRPVLAPPERSGNGGELLETRISISVDPWNQPTSQVPPHDRGGTIRPTDGAQRRSRDKRESRQSPSFRRRTRGWPFDRSLRSGKSPANRRICATALGTPALTPVMGRAVSRTGAPHPGEDPRRGGRARLRSGKDIEVVRRIRQELIEGRQQLAASAARRRCRRRNCAAEARFEARQRTTTGSRAVRRCRALQR